MENPRSKLEKTKEALELVAGVGVLLGIGTAMVATGAVLSTYNFIRRDQTYAKFPHKVKVPKKVREIGDKGFSDRIEVHLEPLTKKAWEFGGYRAYEVRHVNGGSKNNLLAKAVVNGEYVGGFSNPSMNWFYDVSAIFPDVESIFGFPKKVDLKYIGGLTGAERYAHRTALVIATQIGDHSILPVEDHSQRDREDLERRLYGIAS